MREYAPRRDRALQSLAELPSEALAVSSPPNLRYLTGFTGEGLLLLSKTPVLITDRRYETEAQEETSGCEVVAADRGYLVSLVEALRTQAPRRLGFESESLTYAQYLTLRDALPETELVSTTKLVENLRLRKTAPEVELIARAAAIVDGVLDAMLPALAPGPTERQVGFELNRALIEAGAEDLSFTPIVAGGPRSALPHATLSDRVLHSGDMVVLDLGALVEGYCSDITRTVMLGDPSPEFVERYRAVQAAQRARIAAAQPGRPVAEVDQAARQVLIDAGFGEQFSHSLGHGVGLEVHEAPALSARGDYALEVGNVFTVEPGVYFPGWGGIRLEDLFVLEETGPHRLTNACQARY